MTMIMTPSLAGLPVASSIQPNPLQGRTLQVVRYCTFKNE